MRKDIHLALEAAKEARVKLPALETVEEIYEVASEDGYQDLDYAATLTLPNLAGLAPGTHTIAIEVHQFGNAAGDLSMDARLTLG